MWRIHGRTRHVRGGAENGPLDPEQMVKVVFGFTGRRPRQDRDRANVISILCIDHKVRTSYRIDCDKYRLHVERFFRSRRFQYVPHDHGHVLQQPLSDAYTTTIVSTVSKIRAFPRSRRERIYRILLGHHRHIGHGQTTTQWTGEMSGDSAHVVGFHYLMRRLPCEECSERSLPLLREIEIPHHRWVVDPENGETPVGLHQFDLVIDSR